MIRNAIFSPNRAYRYYLERVWNSALPVLAIIGLNPSTADETQDDPTIRRCIAFAKQDGYGAVVMLNLFAYRSTDPKRLPEVYDPIGPHNNNMLRRHTDGRDVLLAWGTRGGLYARDYAVVGLLQGKALLCLGKTKDGHPKHPLYLKSDTSMQPWEGIVPCDT